LGAHVESRARGRRSVLSRLVGVLGGGVLGVPKANAASGDPWTMSKPSPVMEKFRKLEQTEKDLLMYDSELADPNDKTTNQSVERLIPLLRLLDLLKGIAEEAEKATNEKDTGRILEEIGKVAEKLPAKAKRKEADLVNVPGVKLVFNTYSDNIFYSDPDRSNMYLKGGATPTNTQSILYLARNEIITKIEDLVAELRFAGKGNMKEADVEGCGRSLREAIGYFVKELDKDDMKVARGGMK